VLFNSTTFLLFFLPAVLAGFFVLAGFNRHRLAGVWLTCASFFFYGWWNADYLLLLVASILFNYVLGRQLMVRPNRPLLAFGIAANILLLGYYKYTGFLVLSLDQLSGLDWAVPDIVLPLAISFFTFQQIAFLVDAHDGAVTEHGFLNYCLFITFFPHLIAGPITHHREMFPQFSDPNTFRPKLENLAVGLTLFLVGLCKKVVIADTMGEFARPVYAAAAGAAPPSFLEAWGGAVSYTLQIYFDFSGYTDMAIGLGMMFGISLPPNFDSPFKARNIIEFWSRWHMTLTRFVTAYIYNPVVLRLTRWRVRKGLPLPKRGAATPGAFVMLIAFPTILAMFIIGMWHGAGWQFGVFGLLHGVYLTINHGWRQIKVRLGLPIDSNRPLYVVPSVLLTFLCVVIALVFFRADSVAAGLTLLSSMIGNNGFILPDRMMAIPGMTAVSHLFALPVAEL
jgi:D-alanyl-lipoteichoic acid acyltransferase DltB (MBOAT superfamily)